MAITAQQARDLANNSEALKVRALDAQYAIIQSAAEDGRFSAPFTTQPNELVRQYIIDMLTGSPDFFNVTYDGQTPMMITWDSQTSNHG